MPTNVIMGQTRVIFAELLYILFNYVTIFNLGNYDYVAKIFRYILLSLTLANYRLI